MYTGALYDCVEDTIGTAVEYRRNQRVSLIFYQCGACIDTGSQPNNPGAMVQLGWNAGPRHCRVYGLAISYKLKLDTSTKRSHDEDCVGVVTINWNLLKALMPAEVMKETEDNFLRTGLPHMCTPFIAPGIIHFYPNNDYADNTCIGDLGFQITLGNNTFTFPKCVRAPPEAYLVKGYES